MKNIEILKRWSIVLSTALFTACGGGGGGSALGSGAGQTTLNTNSASTTRVETTPGTSSAPVYTAAVYPANWTTTGTVTPPSETSVVTTYPDGYVATTQDGTSSKPFQQATLAGLLTPVTDPSANVSTTTTNYNLTWGMPDKNGPAFAAMFPTIAPAQLGVLHLMGRSVTSYASSVVGPSINRPSADVLAAWNSGWTGLGKNITLLDSYSNIASCSDTAGTTNECHGLHTMLIAGLIAPYANLTALDMTMNSVGKAANTGSDLTTPVNTNVINMSLGFTPCNNGCGGAPTPADFATLTSTSSGWNTNVVALLNTGSNGFNISNMVNSVVVKSAGNAFQDAKYDTTTAALVANTSIASRLLIVGALDRNGTTSSKANIDTLIGTTRYYSNYAGTNVAISDRFVFAYGRDPYSSYSVAFNGTGSPVGQGTSFAAPVVAGYAAVVMQKFPNLDAIKTSSIILDTARYDTLTCFPACDPTIWGRGEASLSRALAPVGRLR
jgi:hypothetical protein